MIVETLFAGRNNVFSIQLFRGNEAVNLIFLSSYELHLSNGRVFNDQDLFVEKDNGVVEISIGHLLTEDDLGTHKTHLVTFDPGNPEGVRWPNFKLKVLE